MDVDVLKNIGVVFPTNHEKKGAKDDAFVSFGHDQVKLLKILKLLNMWHSAENVCNDNAKFYFPAQTLRKRNWRGRSWQTLK